MRIDWQKRGFAEHARAFEDSRRVVVDCVDARKLVECCYKECDCDGLPVFLLEERLGGYGVGERSFDVGKRLRNVGVADFVEHFGGALFRAGLYEPARAFGNREKQRGEEYRRKRENP